MFVGAQTPKFGGEPRFPRVHVGQTFQTLLIVTASLLVALPFLSTFNEFLTKIVEQIGLYKAIEQYIVPWEARMIGVILQPLGIEFVANPRGLQLLGNNLVVWLSWNCIGWQSLILLIITFFTGLQGQYSTRSKIDVLLLGILGTFLINIIRISIVVIVANYFGQLPAVIFHDYASNLLILAWLFLFWWLAYAKVLEPVS